MNWMTAVVALSLAFTVGCTGKKGSGKGKTFVYCSEGSPSAFNPQLATDGPSFNASRNIYNTLVEFKHGSTEIEPALAQSWEISKDGLTYTFKLRPGVKWHTTEGFTSTRDFNADDVIFTFERQMKAEHPFHKVSNASYEYFNSMEMGKIIKSVTKIDDLTVEMKLSQMEAPFLANLAMDFASILSAEYGQKMLDAKTPEKVDTDPVGTGPFVFQSYQKDTMIRFKAFESYWKGKAKLDNLVFAITPDPSVRFQKLKAGECHLVAEPAPADLEAMKSNPKLKVYEKEGLNVGYLAFNNEKAPFNKLEVRQAIHHALNRAAYLDSVYMGRAMVAKNPIPPTIWSYNEAVVDYDYNVEKAKELLKKAGFPNGFETELWTLPVSRPYNPAGKKMGELMQADLAAVGIKVKLVTYDWPTYLEKSRKGEHQLLQLGWNGDNGDPDNFLNVLLGCAAVKAGSNVARWCHKPFNDLVQKAKQTSQQPERVELYKKAQTIFKEQAPWVTLAHSKVYRATAANVEGYQIHPFGSENFEVLDLK
ncbi:MAG: ABC transporter substrate-binding protein [Pseudobdellovibrionaceae bacterium]